MKKDEQSCQAKNTNELNSYGDIYAGCVVVDSDDSLDDKELTEGVKRSSDRLKERALQLKKSDFGIK